MFVITNNIMKRLRKWLDTNQGKMRSACNPLYTTHV